MDYSEVTAFGIDETSKKGHNYITLAVDLKEKKESLMKLHLKTGRALMMREELQEMYETAENRETAEIRLNALCSWIMHSRISEMKPFAKLIKNHFDEILNYFDYQYTNAILEGVNSIIQNIKRRARGFTKACGKLPLEKYAIMV